MVSKFVCSLRCIRQWTTDSQLSYQRSPWWHSEMNLSSWRSLYLVLGTPSVHFLHVFNEMLKVPSSSDNSLSDTHLVQQTGKLCNASNQVLLLIKSKQECIKQLRSSSGILVCVVKQRFILFVHLYREKKYRYYIYNTYWKQYEILAMFSRASFF